MSQNDPTSDAYVNKQQRQIALRNSLGMSMFTCLVEDEVWVTCISEYGDISPQHGGGGANPCFHNNF